MVPELVNSQILLIISHCLILKDLILGIKKNEFLANNRFFCLKFGEKIDSQCLGVEIDLTLVVTSFNNVAASRVRPSAEGIRSSVRPSASVWRKTNRASGDVGSWCGVRSEREMQRRKKTSSCLYLCTLSLLLIEGFILI